MPIDFSCLMPTFGRAPQFLPVLAEAVESFIRQDWPADRRELIILNDAPGQFLHMQTHHPNVFIYNVDRRFPSLAAKYNALTALARGRYLTPWEDDDISLPWRLSVSYHRLNGLDFWRPSTTIFAPHNQPWRYETNIVGLNMSAFCRYTVHHAGGFHGQSDWDQRFILNLKDARPGINVSAQRISRQDVFYVYRWGHGPPHLSAGPAGDAGYQKIGDIPCMCGDFFIEPSWCQDYVKRSCALIMTPGGSE